MAQSVKVKAIRNFSGQKGMILTGTIMELTEPYFTDWVADGLVKPVIESDPYTFKTMQKKGKKDA